MRKNNQAVSFDLHDTILVFKIGSMFSRIRFFRAIFYFLSNFKAFIFAYTFFCKRNEQIIELMKRAKARGDKVIILTSTYEKCARIIYYFLRKNNITDYDEVILRKSFFQKESDYKIEEIIKNNISLHYDDGKHVCAKINARKNVCAAARQQNQ